MEILVERTSLIKQSNPSAYSVGHGVLIILDSLHLNVPIASGIISENPDVQRPTPPFPLTFRIVWFAFPVGSSLSAVQRTSAMLPILQSAMSRV